MDFVPALILALMIKKIVDWIRVLMPDHYEAKLLIPATWVVGIVITLLFSASPELAGGVTVWGEHTLANASIPLVIVYGFAISSGAGVLHDAVRRTTSPRGGVHDAQTPAV